jgi:hypothetical protein
MQRLEVSGVVRHIYIYIYIIRLLKVKEIIREGADWIDLAQGKDHWRAVVNAVVKLGVP